ncbi:MAG: cytidylate kinase-like family protein [Thermoanaerobaculales bacterium]|jgi:cytidylate kinase|nr:cytidylate kinase-like family protein [Thermoanaerobaculales bacterium]
MKTSQAERQSGGIATGPVEYQMRFREIVDRAAGRDRVAEAPQTAWGPFVTISREAASGGVEVARRIGERLGWAVLDKELVNGLAEDLKLEPRLLELMDETRSNWFSETLLNLFHSRLVLQDSYVDLLGKVVALAASAGRVVIVGRGANLILPREHGLRARVVAPLEHRVAEIARAERLDPKSAARRVEEIDGSRRDFIRRHFSVDPTSSELYDIVVSTAAFGIEGAADLVIRAIELRGMPVS